jgi:isopenicillin N synthase-like dioxygenase
VIPNLSTNRSLAETLENDGAALLIAPPPVARLMEELYASSAVYFAASSEVKLRDHRAGGYGYRPFGAEYSQSPDRPDPFESFTAGDATRDAVFETSNARSLNAAMVSLFDALNEMIEDTLVGFAARYGVDADSMTAFARGCRKWSCLQLNYSEPAVLSQTFIHETHEDGHLLSFASATAEGLEIDGGGGEFIAVTAAPPRLVVLPGEIVTLMTGGRIRPLFHRVRASKAVRRRYAVVHFADPDPRTCTPWVAAAINQGIDIGSRILNNPARFGLAPLDLV